MKTTITLLFLTTLCFACKAQSPILPKEGGDYGEIEGAYYKDTFNDLDRFEGTWQYTNGSTEFKVVLQKKEMTQYISPMSGRSFYEDLLIGEYRYTESGVEKVNTLNLITNTYTNAFEHYLAGGRDITKYNPSLPGVCLGCNPGEIKVSLVLREPNVEIPGAYIRIYFRHFVENGVEKLEAEASMYGNPTYNINDPNPTFDEYSLPLDTTFILVKQ